MVGFIEMGGSAAAVATHLRLRLFTRVLTPYVYALLVLFWSTYDTCTEMTLCAIICRLSCVHSCFNATPTLTLILTLALALALTLTLALILNPIYSLPKVHGKDARCGCAPPSRACRKGQEQV